MPIFAILVHVCKLARISLCAQALVPKPACRGAPGFDLSICGRSLRLAHAAGQDA